MAINGIQTAHEARVVAGELQRLVINFGTGLLLFAMSGKEVSMSKDMLNAIQKYSEELLSAASGKQPGEEVFLRQELLDQAHETVEKFFGGFGK